MSDFYAITKRNEKGIYVRNDSGKLYFVDRSCEAPAAYAVVACDITFEKEKYGFVRMTPVNTTDSVMDTLETFSRDIAGDVNFGHSMVSIIAKGDIAVVRQIYPYRSHSYSNTTGTLSAVIGGKWARLGKLPINDIVEMSYDGWEEVISDAKVRDYCRVQAAKEIDIQSEEGLLQAAKVVYQNITDMFHYVSSIRISDKKIITVDYENPCFAMRSYVVTENGCEALYEPVEAGEEIKDKVFGLMLKYHISANTGYRRGEYIACIHGNIYEIQFVSIIDFDLSPEMISEAERLWNEFDSWAKKFLQTLSRNDLIRYAWITQAKYALNLEKR